MSSEFRSGLEGPSDDNCKRGVTDHTMRLISDAYPETQIRFQWEDLKLVAGMVLSQYDLIATPKYNVSYKINENGKISMRHPWSDEQE